MDSMSASAPLPRGRHVACTTCAGQRRRCDGRRPVCGACAGDGVGAGVCVFPNPTRTKQTRLKRGLSCAVCRATKRTCDGAAPCARCVARGAPDECSNCENGNSTTDYNTQPQRPPVRQPAQQKSSTQPSSIDALQVGTLFPSLPPGLLPPAPVLRRAIDAFFDLSIINLVHKPTLEARVSNGEDPARVMYRARFRSRVLALQRGSSSSLPALPVAAAGRLVPELRPGSTVEPHMDALLLAVIVWSGASMSSRITNSSDDGLSMSQQQLDALEAWIADEISEVMAWFAAVGSTGNGISATNAGLELLWAEMTLGSSFSAGNAAATGPSSPPPPFTSPELPPIEREAYITCMNGYHRDMFDVLVAYAMVLWTFNALGRAADHATLALTVASRITPMCRLGEWCARAPDDERDSPAAWIRAEEKVRLVAVFAASVVLSAEMRSVAIGPTSPPSPASVPGAAQDAFALSLDLRSLAAVELPCHDVLFNQLPAAIGPSAPQSYTQQIHAFAGYPRQRLTLGQAAMWMELPRGSPMREAALARSFGRVWDLGPWSFLTLVGMLMLRHAGLRAWLHARGMEAYELDLELEKDAEAGLERSNTVTSMGTVTSNGSSSIDVSQARLAFLAEAKAKRSAFLEALEDAERHLPPEFKEVYDAGDGDALRKLGTSHYGARNWPRLAAYAIWLHTLHILARSPGDFVAALAETDERWLRGPGFVSCAAHAISVSRLAAAVMNDSKEAGNAASYRMPQFVPVAVLRAGFVHALMLGKLTGALGGAAANQNDQSAALVRQLVEDTAACLRALQLGGASWAYTRQAHRVFEKIVLQGDMPSAEELEALRTGMTTP